MTESKIVEWTERSWNPVTGCNKVSSGCTNCYAEKQVKWLLRMKNPRYFSGFNLTMHEDLLESPKRWRKPRQVFHCCAMVPMILVFL